MPRSVSDLSGGISIAAPSGLLCRLGGRVFGGLLSWLLSYLVLGVQHHFFRYGILVLDELAGYAHCRLACIFAKQVEQSFPSEVWP